MFSIFKNILQNISINELTNCRDITETKEFLQKFGYALNFEELEAFKAFFNSPKQQGDNLGVLTLSELYNVAGGFKGLIIHANGKIEFFNNPNASFSPNTIIFRDQLSCMHTLSKLHIPNKYDIELNKDGYFRHSMFGRQIFDFDPSGDEKKQLKIHAKSFNYDYVFFQAINEFHQAVEACTRQHEAHPQVPEVQHSTTESQFHINVVESAAGKKQLGTLNLSNLDIFVLKPDENSKPIKQFLQLSLMNEKGVKYNLSFDLTEAQAQKYYDKLSELSITKNLELIVDGKVIKGKFSLEGDNEQNYHYLTSPSEETLHHYFGGDFLVLQQHTGECAHPIETDYYHANMHDMKGMLEILKNVPQKDVFKVLTEMLNSDFTQEQKDQISNFIKTNYHVSKGYFEGILEAIEKNTSRKEAFETFANMLSADVIPEQIHQIYDFVKENYNIFSSTNFFKDHLAKLSHADKKDFDIEKTKRNLYISTFVVCLLASALIAGITTDYDLGDPLDL